jgi:hypothetical protein
VATSVATSDTSVPSRSSAPQDTSDAAARYGRIWHPHHGVEGLVRITPGGGSSPLRRIRKAPQRRGFSRSCGHRTRGGHLLVTTPSGNRGHIPWPRGPRRSGSRTARSAECCFARERQSRASAQDYRCCLVAALRRWLKCGASGSRSDEQRSIPGDTMSATGRATWHDLSLADREALFYFGKGRT